MSGGLTNHVVQSQFGSGIENPINTTGGQAPKSYSIPVQRLHAYVQGAPLAVCPKAWGPVQLRGFHLWIRNRLKTGGASSLDANQLEPVIMIDGMRAPARAQRDDPAQLYTLCPNPFQDVTLLSRGAALDLVAALSPLARAGMVQRIMHARSVRAGCAEWMGWDANTAALMWALVSIEALERGTAQDFGGVQ